MNIKWNEYTWYSKLAAAIFFILILPVWTFYIGMEYRKTIDLYQNPFTSIDTTGNHVSTFQRSATTTSQDSSEMCTDQTTLGMAACAQDEFEKEDQKLSQLYNKIIADYDATINNNSLEAPAYQSLKSALVKSENDWVLYRDNYCVAQTGIDIADEYGALISGSITRINYPACKTQLTKNHIQELNAMKTGM